MRLSATPLKEIAGVFVIALLFIATAYYSGAYESYLQGIFLGESKWGMFIYVAVTILAIVIAPISTFPLLPFAVALWGSLIAALLSIVGWTLGGILAFIVARELGRPIAQRFVNMERAQKIARAVSGGNLFLSIVFLRIILPVDILSYALGLFVSVPLSTYTLATLVGVTPFAFIFSYTVPFSVHYQVITLMLAAVVVVVGYLHIRRKIRDNQ